MHPSEDIRFDPVHLRAQVPRVPCSRLTSASAPPGSCQGPSWYKCARRASKDQQGVDCPSSLSWLHGSALSPRRLRQPANLECKVTRRATRESRSKSFLRRLESISRQCLSIHTSNSPATKVTSGRFEYQLSQLTADCCQPIHQWYSLERTRANDNRPPKSQSSPPATSRSGLVTSPLTIKLPPSTRRLQNFKLRPGFRQRPSDRHSAVTHTTSFRTTSTSPKVSLSQTPPTLTIK